MSDTAETLPKLGSVEWSEYAMKHFTEDELYDTYPKVDGLRRVVELLIGTISDSSANVVQVPTPENDQRATVEFKVTVITKDNLYKTYTSAADVYGGNADMYANHPVALAETRAEGRALRKALQLKHIVSAEERLGSEEKELDVSKINNAQITGIQKLCEKLKIEVEKFINMGEGKYNDIKDIPYRKAMEMVKLLNSYQRNMVSIPKVIRERE